MSESLDPGLVAFRPAVPEDLNFIRNSWLKSYRKAHVASRMTDTLYFALWKYAVVSPAIVRAVKGEVILLVACNADIPDQIFGWAATEPREDLLHYVYVKHPFRRLGLCRQMLALLGINHDARATWTHSTDAAVDYLARYCAGYEPEWAIPEEEDDDDRAA